MSLPFTTLLEFSEILKTPSKMNSSAYELASARNEQLTKPVGALGRLEDLALWYAGWRGQERPSLERPQVLIFAGNHGVTAQGISVFPPEVTAQMVLNFETGGAAINQLSGCFGAKLDVHALDLDRPTQDLTEASAMSEDECVQALGVGWTSVDENADLLVTGEMGIGNTTAAAAIALALFGGTGADWAGRGTGLGSEGVALKAQVVEAGLARHSDAKGDGLVSLMSLGGREIAAMAGAIARARVIRIPVILDGFICCAAAATLYAVANDALDHCVAGHLSAEGAHRRLLERLGKEPLLSLGLRLGEGSGGTLAISVLKAAIACHTGMVTFAEAGVSAG
tara:strand:+ start:73 stop:1089 length:1017 start_codon:yes stop_codon:yes gene_type:complete